MNPSGKLPYTVGKSLEDYGEGGQVLYKPNGVVPQQDFSEKLYIDYRHFDKVRSPLALKIHLSGTDTLPSLQYRYDTRLDSGSRIRHLLSLLSLLRL